MTKTRHYQSLALLPALLIFGGLAKADLCSSEANYAALETAGSCTIGDKTYSDFTALFAATGGATELTASGITFTTINNGLVANGFTFEMSLDANSGQTNDVNLGYNVSITTPGTHLIASSNLAMEGLGIGEGVSSIAETDCIGSPVPSCPAGDSFALSTFASAFGSSPSDTNSFAGTTELGVSKDVNVTGGTIGFASISGVTETVDQVLIPTPEPASIVFFGTMLLGVTAVIRKRQAKRS